jgi:hypothetical protein
VQPSRTATVCEVDRARKRAASRKRAQTSDTGQPLETYHPETTHLTAPCSCEVCSAFTRVAARTLAPSPIRDLLHRRLQPFCYLHDCSGCFRLERLPGGARTHWKSAALARRTRQGDIPYRGACRQDFVTEPPQLGAQHIYRRSFHGESVWKDPWTNGREPFPGD